MKKLSAQSDENEYRIRGSTAFLILRLLSIGIVFWLFNFILTSFLLAIAVDQNVSIVAITASILLFLNILVFIFFILQWRYKYYIVNPAGFSKNYGIIKRSTETYDFKSIRCIEVHQSIIGKIFGYGTILLESPLLKKNVYIENVPTPFKHAKYLEERRLEYLEGAESVTPIYT